MLRDRMLRILLETAATETTGGGSTETPPAPKPAETAPPDTAAAEKLIAKHGSAAEAVRELMKDNHSVREKNRELSAKVPEGAVVLKPEQAKAWEAYRQLGEPAELKTAKEERTAFANEVAGFKRRDIHAEAAAIADGGKGYKASVLNRLAEQDGITIEVVNEQKDGKPVKVARVKDGETTTPLDQYAASKWADFLPALKGSGQATTQTRAGGTPPPASGPGMPRIEQTAVAVRRKNVL